VPNLFIKKQFLTNPFLFYFQKEKMFVFLTSMGNFKKENYFDSPKKLKVSFQSKFICKNFAITIN
jgi:hypothetical protein